MPSLGSAEGNHTSGGFPLVFVLRGGGTSPLRSEFPLCNKAKLNFMPAFFFDTRGPKKKAWQKRNAAKGVSPSAEGDRRSRRLRRAFEKARAKLSIRHRRDAPTNCNLIFRLNSYLFIYCSAPADKKAFIFSLLGLPNTSSGVPCSSITPSAINTT